MIRQLLGSAMASAVGTLCDYGLFLVLMMLGASLTPSVIVGGVVGACINFVLARHAVFKAADGMISRQALLFAAGAGVSILLNAICANVLVLVIASPAIARAIGIVLVAALFNFPYQKWVVFKVAQYDP